MHTQRKRLQVRHILLLCVVVLAAPEIANASRELASSQAPQARGTFRHVHAMFFKLYDLTLYTDAPAQATPAEVLNGQHTLRLEFNYLRTIKKEIILESGEKILQRNLSPSELASIEDRVAQLNDAYTTVHRGDQSALSYKQGHGTSLEINGHSIITIPGDDFASLYFRIWLGDQPISSEMRDYLMTPKKQ
ncbi:MULTISPECIES: chalcone isomerase family protein [unclassified Lentimonas]|uniref:chalcone isomerase family protein n=1 Tax=unclassified Lentimonas TaxID=2630993 RepID=UPI0013257EBE|nr:MULTISPECIES: chalcone isomerase family protein [unclassified Lentimonas]CAA6679704.1 Unannotated [Lentimonas sp. CC4]CAA6683530.1 Unannotated [Lentimonas sp. CC6]CAA7077291.1 Unannotated [Lentimonas sp. CC4]CAA7170194.1 Unannotated [Lentimonas sp. CC21]CAA7182418.1 Unannotated [Lentimonas sp. CC8]